MLARLTPDEAAYGQYRGLVDYYLGLVRPVVRRGKVDHVVGYRLRRSTLFPRYEYLVAYVDEQWLRGVAPDCDAISTPMLGPKADWLQAPPLVCVPETRRRSRTEDFVATLEHEFVHINQTILGTFRPFEHSGQATDLVDLVVSRSVCEYQAYFLQHMRWPALYTEEAQLHTMSLDHWCLLRAYGPALEEALHAAAAHGFPRHEVSRFLDTLPDALPRVLRGAGMEQAWAPSLRAQLRDHIGIALGRVARAGPKVETSPALREAARWLQRLSRADGA